MGKRTDLTLGLIAVAGAGALLAARAAMQKARVFDFQGKIALITGGSRGLGLVLARQLVREGCSVAVCARDEAELENARLDLEGKGGRVLTVACDLHDRAQVEAMVRKVVEHFGRIDLLVNNAGTISVGPIENMQIEDFEEQMRSNYWSAVYTTFAVLPYMRRNGHGRITNITSIGGKMAVPHLLPYCASKFAFVGFSRGLRTEVYKDGIVVTTICPGLMRTGSPRNADFKGQHEAEYAWFSISDSSPLLSIAAERAAHEIIEATRRGDVEVVLSGPAKLGAAFDSLLPELSGDVMAVAARFLPRPTAAGDERKKGFESESPLAPSLLTAPSERAALRNNQV